MELDTISTIEDWPVPESVCNGQLIVGFTSFYRQFIRKYALVTTPISALLKKSVNSRMSKWVQCEWTWDAELVFPMSKLAFSDVPILKHFEQAKLIILHADASGCAIAGIFNQYIGFIILRLADFYSRKCSSARQINIMHNWKPWAVVETTYQ